MWLDAVLVCVHLSAMLALIVFLTATAGALRCHADPARLRRLTRMQTWVWGSLLAVLASGVALVLWGAKGAPWLLHNPLLWAKVALWLAATGMAWRVSRRIAGWRRLALGHPPEAVNAKLPGEASAYAWLMVQAHLLAIPPLLGVLLSRGLG